MSLLAAKLLSPFYFTRSPATIIALIFYVFVFGSVLYSNSLPPVRQSKDFDRALADLSNITARPHPILSHANDQVRSYLLSRIQSLNSDLQIIDDLNSTVKYASKSRPSSSYFEGSNILVKVPGSEQNDSDAVLISAHFDSVYTAPGVTDNGIGVVAALQLLEHLADFPVDKRPRRSAIFNFNNGEEDGLYGAHVYMVHPWVNLTTTFLNIDGAGAGGRPMLFRSTSMSPMASFIHARPKVGYYHTNVLSQDVFGMGVIRSSTDWQVYGEYMDGVDLAFYRNRALYHTRFDSLEYAEGGPRALQAMIETIKSGGIGLLNAHRNNNDVHMASSVHLDILGRFFLIMELNTMFIINVVLLVVGPVIAIILLVIYLLGKQKRLGSPRSDTNTAGTRLWRMIKALLGVSQFWLCFVISVAVQIGLAIGFLTLNPFVIHSRPTLVLSSVLMLAYLAVVMSITSLQATGVSATKSKLISLASQHLLTWILLVISTIYVRKFNIGGTYWITIWNACSFLGLLVALIQSTLGVFTEGKLGGGDAAVYEEVAGDDTVRPQDRTRKYVRGLEHQAEPRADEQRDSDIRETGPTEITPLINQHRQSCEVVAVDMPSPSSKGDEIGWWILQMVLTVPLPALLMYEITTLLMDSLSQTMVDGSNPLIVYAALCAMSTFILLPLTPFAHRMHGFLTYVIFFSFVVTTLYCWMVFPFTQGSPMRFSFQQSVDLDAGSSLVVQGQSPVMLNMKGISSVTGLDGYINRVVASLPSARRNVVSCNSTAARLTTCKWEVGEEWLPSPGGDDSAGGWIQADVKRLNETFGALISIKGKNTRGCRINFDTAVREYDVRELDGRGWAGQVPRGYTAVPRGGVKEILLWSRTWDRAFEVRVRWDGDEGLTGRVTCAYAEYASGAAVGDVPGKDGRIPAFEEVLRFAPRWATATKNYDGLVEVFTRFRV